MIAAASTSASRPLVGHSTARARALRNLQLPQRAFRASLIPARRQCRVSAVWERAATRAFAPSTSGDDVQGDIVKPSPFNNPWVRLLSVIGSVAISAQSAPLLPTHASGFVHLVALSLLLGVNFWTTFIAGITMFKNLPRQTFGRLQSKLFPAYFALSTICSSVMLGLLVVGAKYTIMSKPVIVLGIALAGSIANWVWIEPTATSILFERYDLENADVKDSDKIKALYKTFSKWHGVSSLANLAVLIATISHTYFISGFLTLF